MSGVDRANMKRIITDAREKIDKADTERSKAKLTLAINKKIKTTMIGAIDQVEKVFGDLWGHGQDYYDLDKDQKEWRKKWEHIRTQILNTGNNQIRAAEKEISEYDLSWRKYTYTFFPVKDKVGGTKDES